MAVLITQGQNVKDWRDCRAKMTAAWIKSIADFDWDNIDAKTLKKTASYAKHEDLVHENIQKKSAAAAGLAQWVRNISEYCELRKGLDLDL